MLRYDMARKCVIALIVLSGLYVLSPFLVEMGMGAIFAVLFYPWMKRIEHQRFPNRLAAGLFTLAATTLLFLPVCLMTIAGVKSGLNELALIKHQHPEAGTGSSSDVLDNMLQSTGVERLLVRAARVAPIDSGQMSEQIKELLVNTAGHIGDALSRFISHIPNMLLAFSVFLFSMYYFLADGLKFVVVIRERSFFTKAETEKLMTTFSGLCRSVILASVISGCAQATMAAAVSLAVGIRQFPLVFLIILIASFIPLLGSFPIMAGMALYQYTSGNPIASLALTIAAVVVASIDHVIRPQVIRGHSNLHPLLGLISALGGLEILGISGVFLGPVLCGLFIEVLELARAKTPLHNEGMGHKGS